MKLIIRVGGSVVASPLNPKLINDYVRLLFKLTRQGHTVAAVIGGGSLSREVIKTARAMGLSETAQDEVAISASRVIAQLFVLMLGTHGTLTVPITIDDAVKSFKENKIVVMGGLRPGMTTDSVAALLAERLSADFLVKTSNVNGIYTKDPKKYEEAEKLERLNFKDLYGLFGKEKHEAGINQVIDPEAVRILQKCQIKTIVVNGFEPKNVLLAVKGEKIGTLIS